MFILPTWRIYGINEAFSFDLGTYPKFMKLVLSKFMRWLEKYFTSLSLFLSHLKKAAEKTSAFVILCLSQIIYDDDIQRDLLYSHVAMTEWFEFNSSNILLTIKIRKIKMWIYIERSLIGCNKSTFMMIGNFNFQVLFHYKLITF